MLRLFLLAEEQDDLYLVSYQKQFLWPAVRHFAICPADKQMTVRGEFVHLPRCFTMALL